MLVTHESDSANDNRCIKDQLSKADVRAMCGLLKRGLKLVDLEMESRVARSRNGEPC
jgi:hypothetical protein